MIHGKSVWEFFFGSLWNFPVLSVCHLELIKWLVWWQLLFSDRNFRKILLSIDFSFNWGQLEARKEILAGQFLRNPQLCCPLDRAPKKIDGNSRIFTDFWFSLIGGYFKGMKYSWDLRLFQKFVPNVGMIYWCAVVESSEQCTIS